MDTNLRKQTAHLTISEDLHSSDTGLGHGGRCYISELPDKVLARIFAVGVRGEEDDDHDEDLGEGAGGPEEHVNGYDHDQHHGNGTARQGVDGADIHNHDPEDDEDHRHHDHYGTDHHHHHLPFQILISHVCTHWRNIALGTPSLWTTLSFTRLTCLDRIRAHIERSASCPLSIFIDASVPEFSAGSKTATSAVFRLLSGTMENGSGSVATIGGLPGYGVQDGEGAEDDEDDEALEVTSLRDYGSPSMPSGTRQEKLFLTPKDLVEIFDLVEPLVQRWKEFHFDTNTYLYIPLVLSRLGRLPEAPPLLDCLALFSSQTLKEYEDDLLNASSTTNVGEVSNKRSNLRRSSSISLAPSAQPPFAGKIPNLKTLALWGIPIDQWMRSGSSLLESMDKVESLSLSFQTEDALRDILRLVPNVHTLSLNYEPPRMRSPNSTPGPATPSSSTLQTSLSRLADLTLHAFEPRIAAALVRTLRAPNLLRLRFEKGSDDYQANGPQHSSSASSLSVPTPAVQQVQPQVQPSRDYTPFILALTAPSSGIDLTRLDTLELQGLYCADEAAFDAFIRQLSSLKTLVVEWDSVEDGGDQADDAGNDVRTAAPSGAEQIVRKLGQERVPEGGVFIPPLDNLSLANVETSEQLRVVREALDSRHILSGFKAFKSLRFP